MSVDHLTHGPIILETKRLVLRPLRVSDTDDIAGYAPREEFWRYLPLPPLTWDSSAEFVARKAAQQPDENGDWSFAAEHRAAGRVIGAFRIGKIDQEARAADLGFGVDPDYWGQGLATEAAHALLAFGFGALNLHRIWATADMRNEASWRVMEKVGMKREGLLREHVLVRGAWRSSVLYSILAHEFSV